MRRDGFTFPAQGMQAAAGWVGAWLAWSALSCLPAQVPEGHLVVASNRLYSGQVGLFVAHPRANAPMTAILGTGASAWTTSSSGPECVAIHDPTGDLLVGEIGTGSLVLHRFRLQGLTVAQHTTIPVGTTTNFGGIYAVAQQDEHHALLACVSLTSAAGPPMYNDIVQVDLRNGALVRVYGWSSLFTLQGLAYEAATGSIFYSQIYSSSSAVSIIQGSTNAILARTNVGAIQGIAIDVNGDLLCSAYNNGRVVIRITRQGVVSYPYGYPGNYPGIAREAATGQLFVVTGGAAMVQQLDPGTGALTTLTSTIAGGGTLGYLSAIALAQDPFHYGGSSGDGPYRWSALPNPQGLPLAGQPWTVEVDWSGMPATWSALVIGSASASAPWHLPGPAANLDPLLAPNGLLGWLPMGLDAMAAHSSTTMWLPPAVAGTTLFLQSLHVTTVGTLGASDGLRSRIL